jgi:hypothetical protein
MMKKIVGISFIFVCITIAWMILAGTLAFRSSSMGSKLATDVGKLWGSAQNQQAPAIDYFTEKKTVVDAAAGSPEASHIKIEKIRHDIPIQSSKIDVSLDLHPRKKGLLWYSTYKVSFSGIYTVTNKADRNVEAGFHFTLPQRDAVYDDFKISVDGVESDDFSMDNGAATCTIPMKPGQSRTLKVTYRSQGMKEWWYSFGSSVSRVHDFTLIAHTNFHGVDFPPNSVSPTSKEKAGKGWTLTWHYDNLLSGVQLGIAMPRKLNPGPWVRRVTTSAPVSLFLFFFLLLIISTRLEISLHPMHYFFIGAAYFSFHLLMAYLVDHVSLQMAFVVSSVVSLFLVTSYMRIVSGPKFGIVYVGLAQLVYQVLFSCTYFLKSFTGLAITILCIVTLFIVMQVTARLDWEKIFEGEH